MIASPLTGPEGNREFLVHLAPGPGCAEIAERIAEATAATTVVAAASSPTAGTPALPLSPGTPEG